MGLSELVAARWTWVSITLVMFFLLKMLQDHHYVIYNQRLRIQDSILLHTSSTISISITLPRVNLVHEFALWKVALATLEPSVSTN